MVSVKHQVSARGGRGGGGLVKLSRHDSPVITHVPMVTGCSGVAAYARDVTDLSLAWCGRGGTRERRKQSVMTRVPAVHTGRE
jgi:hypothetical protein